MRTAAVVCALLAIAALGLRAPAPGEDEQDGPDLSFLTGHWRGTLGGTIMDEHWFPPEHGSTTGMLRWFADDGSIRMLELLAITPGADDGVDFRLRHFDGAMTPWEAEKDAPMSGVIASHAPGKLVIRLTGNARDTETLTYERAGEDGLRVTIAFKETSGRSPVVIDFEKRP